MKKNLNINIGSRVFNIDEDAYDLLSKYLESIKKYFEKINIDEDISNDIENRISEKFNSNYKNFKAKSNDKNEEKQQQEEVKSLPTDNTSKE